MRTGTRRRDVVRSMLFVGALGLGGCLGRPGDGEFDPPTTQPPPDPPAVSFEVTFPDPSGTVEVTNASETSVDASNTGELFIPLGERVTEAEDGSAFDLSRGWLLFDSNAETAKGEPIEPGDTRSNVLILDTIETIAILWSPPGKSVTETKPQIIQQVPVPDDA